MKQVTVHASERMARFPGEYSSSGVGIPCTPGEIPGSQDYSTFRNVLVTAALLATTVLTVKAELCLGCSFSDRLISGISSRLAFEDC